MRLKENMVQPFAVLGKKIAVDVLPLKGFKELNLHRACFEKG